MDNAQPAPSLAGQAIGAAIGAAEAGGAALAGGAAPAVAAADAAGVVIDDLAQAPIVRDALTGLHARIAALEANNALLAAIAGVLKRRFPQDLAGLL